TTARSAPWRTWSVLARPPRARASASTSRDLPLPVSPVSRLSPGPNLTCARSTRARSRTWSSFSTSLARARLGIGHQRQAPAQLVPEDVVEALRRREANQRQLPVVGRDRKPIARPQPAGGRAVHSQGGAVPRQLDG